MSAILSVVIAAKNCADRIEGTVLPWKGIADEIIVADQMSTDSTAEVAQSLGCRVMKNNPPGGNFDLNRKLAMQAAVGRWILYIDTDERPMPALLTELKAFLESEQLQKDVNGVRIPNEFYFLGKPLRHGIFNPRSAEIRLVRREAWSYPCEDGFHRGVSVSGKVIRFQSGYKHFNVNTLSEWFIKTNQYTEHDAEKAIKENPGLTDVPTYGAFFDAIRFFVRHYIVRLGFLDGFHGLVSVFYFMLYHLTLKIKIWERIRQRDLVESRDYLKSIDLPKR